MGGRASANFGIASDKAGNEPRKARPVVAAYAVAAATFRCQQRVLTLLFKVRAGSALGGDGIIFQYKDELRSRENSFRLNRKEQIEDIAEMLPFKRLGKPLSGD